MSYQVRVWFTEIGREPDYSVCVAIHRFHFFAQVNRMIRQIVAGNGANYFVEPAADRAGRAGKGMR